MAKKKLKAKRTTKGKIFNLKGLFQKVEKVANLYKPQSKTSFGIGDTVKVHVKIKEGDKERIQIFEGIVMGRRGQGANRSFMVRKVSHGVGVERVFLENSPKVANVEVVQKGLVRRAKLYYLRDLEGKAAKVERDQLAQRDLNEQRQKEAQASK